MYSYSLEGGGGRAVYRCELCTQCVHFINYLCVLELDGLLIPLYPSSAFHKLFMCPGTECEIDSNGIYVLTLILICYLVC